MNSQLYFLRKDGEWSAYYTSSEKIREVEKRFQLKGNQVEVYSVFPRINDPYMCYVSDKKLPLINPEIIDWRDVPARILIDYLESYDRNYRK